MQLCRFCFFFPSARILCLKRHDPKGRKPDLRRFPCKEAQALYHSHVRARFSLRSFRTAYQVVVKPPNSRALYNKEHRKPHQSNQDFRHLVFAGIVLYRHHSLWIPSAFQGQAFYNGNPFALGAWHWNHFQPES